MGKERPDDIAATLSSMRKFLSSKGADMVSQAAQMNEDLESAEVVREIYSGVRKFLNGGVEDGRYTNGRKLLALIIVLGQIIRTHPMMQNNGWETMDFGITLTDNDDDE